MDYKKYNCYKGGKNVFRNIFSPVSIIFHDTERKKVNCKINKIKNTNKEGALFLDNSEK